MQCLSRPEEGVGSPGAGAKVVSCCVRAGNLKLGPKEEQS